MKLIDATLSEVDAAVKGAQLAFLSYKNYSGKRKGEFLRAIADEIEALGGELVKTAMHETNLPEARIISERARTTGHLRMFAQLVEEGSWVDARIDEAIPDRTPLPKPDLRKMLVPIGPIVVFGAANFPLAYSTAGGDTASALASGCPVIVKAHPAHAETSQMVADAIFNAMRKLGMPSGVFQHLHGASFEVGSALVEHPLTKAVGFTGSLMGGKALFDLANRRQQPIPVFAEMSSTNPVVLLPQTLSKEIEPTAVKLAGSITLGVGQFCTAPGLIIALQNDSLARFMTKLTGEIQKILPATMLHEGIANNYHHKLAAVLGQQGVRLEGESFIEGSVMQGRPTLASVEAQIFLKNPLLAEEVFGPFALVIKCNDMNELVTVINHIHGQLTTTIIGDTSEVQEHTALWNTIKEKAGRIIFNGVPTGVEVCPSMMHGGPYPATTDSRFTAVGTDAIKRFVRPLCFQNFPETLLPDELKNANPLNIWRLRNNEWTKD